MTTLQLATRDMARTATRTPGRDPEQRGTARGAARRPAPEPRPEERASAGGSRAGGGRGAQAWAGGARARAVDREVLRVCTAVYNEKNAVTKKLIFGDAMRSVSIKFPQLAVWPQVLLKQEARD